MKSKILDPRFRYTPSHQTNIRETFDRVRDELKRKNIIQLPQGKKEPNVPR